MTTNVLLMGGTADATYLCQKLHDGPKQLSILYSTVGIGHNSKAHVHGDRCVHRFGAIEGNDATRQLLINQQIDLVVDATHPYAAQIKKNLRICTSQLNIPYWRLHRMPWVDQPGDQWEYATGFDDIIKKLKPYRRPFMTIGQQAFKMLPVPDGQYWFIRSIDIPSVYPNTRCLQQKGPFNLEHELELMQNNSVDVLVSKNSGGSAVYAKIAAARELGIPVIMLDRPKAPEADRMFNDRQSLLEAVLNR